MHGSINERIIRYRKLAALTQIETAELLGIKSSTYSQLERSGKISADRLVALAEIFGVSTDQLLYGEEAPVETIFDKPLGTPTGVRLHEPNDPPYKTTEIPFIPTKTEENIIKIYRNLKKSDKEDILKLIEEKFKNSKN